MENNKTPEELLREQLELLAERSKYCEDAILPQLTSAMVSIYTLLEPHTVISNQFSLKSD